MSRVRANSKSKRDLENTWSYPLPRNAKKPPPPGEPGGGGFLRRAGGDARQSRGQTYAVITLTWLAAVAVVSVSAAPPVIAMAIPVAKR